MWWATWLSLATTGCGGSGNDQRTPDAGQGFGHNSPRPDCHYAVDPSRVPYAMPQVVATAWGAPVKLPTLNTPCPEDAIEISRDGTTLYFYWSPTVNASFDERLNGTAGTYYAQRVAADLGSFANPRFFDLRRGVSGGASDGEVSFTPTGEYVYFHSTRSANTGYRQSPPVDDPMDIYVAPIVNGEPGPAENLGEVVNSAYLDGEHCLSPDGTKLYLASTRPGGLGGADIWVSARAGNAWSEPANLGAPINSTGGELQPAFAADDPNTMFFVSDRDGPASIYKATFGGAVWSAPVMMLTGYVGEPSLVTDGSVMYFVHVLVDDKGVFGSDIWYVKRN